MSPKSNDDVARDARAILFPAFDSDVLPIEIEKHLDLGGVALLIGESREEYLERRMSSSRRNHETSESIRDITDQAIRRAGRSVLVGVDQEPWGIGRLNHLIGAPTRDEILELDAESLEDVAKEFAALIASLGVNLLLAPVIDVEAGMNPWLSGRTASQSMDEVSKLAAAFVRGVQSEDRIAATAKHFPGHRHVTGDPAVELAEVVTTLEVLAEDLEGFRKVVDVGVKAVMTGPAVVTLLDSQNPASLSTTIMNLLREEVGFKGLIITDDLDSVSTLQGSSVASVSTRALSAGADLLLLASGPQLEEVVEEIVRSVREGRVSRDRLSTAAEKVRNLAESLT